MSGSVPSHDESNTVDADRDPTVVRIEELRTEANQDAEYAQAEAEFAMRERERAARQRAAGHKEEADATEKDAIGHMQDAGHVMKESNAESDAADTLEAQQQQKLAVVLRELPNQGVATLRDAVSSVRAFVSDLSPNDAMKVRLASGMDDVHLERVRAQAIARGVAVEEALSSPHTVRTRTLQVIQDLVAFVAAVMTIADHLEPLMKLVQQYGTLLLQFRI